MFDSYADFDDKEKLMICKLNIVELMTFEEYLVLKDDKNPRTEELSAILGHF